MLQAGTSWMRTSPLQVLITRSCEPSLHEPNYALHLEVADYINNKKANKCVIYLCVWNCTGFLTKTKVLEKLQWRLPDLQTTETHTSPFFLSPSWIPSFSLVDTPFTSRYRQRNFSTSLFAAFLNVLLHFLILSWHASWTWYTAGKRAFAAIRGGRKTWEISGICIGCWRSRGTGSEKLVDNPPLLMQWYVQVQHVSSRCHIFCLTEHQVSRRAGGGGSRSTVRQASRTHPARYTSRSGCSSRAHEIACWR